MRNVWVVIRREYLERVRSKWFIASTVAAPLVMAVIVLLPAFMAVQDQEARSQIAVLDRTGVLADRVARRLADAGFGVEGADPESENVESRLTVRTLEGELGGYLVLDAGTLESGRALFRTRQRPGAMQRLAVQSAVAQSALEVRLARTGSDEGVRELLSGGEVVLDVLGREGVGGDDPAFLAAFVGAMLLYFVIFFYAQAVMRAVLEEKTSRVVEIVVSALRPWHLMLGKVLGVGAVGLTQLAVWTVCGVALVMLGLPAAASAAPEGLAMDAVGQVLPSAGLLVLFLTMFLLGYFLYAALYAAVGAMCSTDEEAQQAQFGVVLLIVIPVLALMPVLNAPTAPLSVVLSLIPFFAPVLIYPRAVAGAVAPWEVVAAVLLLVLAIVGVAWVAGRIYRVGILMQGKRPTVRELWRWVREA